MVQFALPIFIGAFLLFQIQPLIARCILPWFGGTPAVWTTCMLFFQLLLLGGYGYAHAIVSRLRPRGQALTQTVVMALSLALMGGLAFRWGVPLIPDASWKPADPSFPIPRILALLSVSVGLPYFVLATTSPLLQSWFSRANPGKSPYRLYTLSNIGSLLALLSYPFLIEPALAMRSQATMWSAVYVVFILTYLACAVRAARGPQDMCELDTETATDDLAPDCPPRPTAREWALWIGLPALASALLLAVTNQMCQEVAVIPFLWIVPLSLYLLTFIICFDNPRWYIRDAYLPLMLLAIGGLALVMQKQDTIELKIQLPLYALTLFVCCMFLHGETVARKPRPRHLTAFYLAIALGGALGGLLVAVVAPLIFKRFYELHLSLLACWGLGLLTIWRWPTIDPLVRKLLTGALLACTLILGLSFVFHKGDTEAKVILSCRNFYGIFYVKEENANDPEECRHKLVHGGTVHGLQYMSPERQGEPLSYYTPSSGIGLALQHHPRRLAGQPLKIGVVGLGTGTLAAYGKPGDTLRYYEINPGVVKMARDPRYFTFLRNCPAKLEIVMGDARLSLERELRESGGQQYDVIALDAFSSDAIPAHLLTREALALYLQHLRQPDGILAIHASNRALDLKPIAFGLADEAKLHSALIVDGTKEAGTYHSDWILCSRSGLVLKQEAIEDARSERPAGRKLRLWTDDYYNLFQILK